MSPRRTAYIDYSGGRRICTPARQWVLGPSTIPTASGYGAHIARGNFEVASSEDPWAHDIGCVHKMHTSILIDIHLTSTPLARMVTQAPSSPRIAIITGAAQGIGEAIALRLADDGIDVVLNDLPTKRDALDGVVKAVRAKGRRAIAVLGDATVEADVVALIDKAIEEFGGLDIVRNLFPQVSSPPVPVGRQLTPPLFPHTPDGCKRGNRKASVPRRHDSRRLGQYDVCERAKHDARLQACCAADDPARPWGAHHRWVY